jgi:hypothetical protein
MVVFAYRAVAPAEKMKTSIPGVFHHFPHSHAKSLAYALQCIKSNVLFTTFDRTVVGSVHSNLIRVAFLAVALRLPPVANSKPKPNMAADFLHVVTRYRPSSLSSTVL